MAALRAGVLRGAAGQRRAGMMWAAFVRMRLMVVSELYTSTSPIGRPHKLREAGDEK